MFIRTFTDIHIEFMRIDGKPPWTPVPMDTDKDTVLVLAGDIDVGKHTKKYVDTLASRFKYIVYVLGNHDMWNQNIHKVYDKFRSTKENVFLLQNESVTLDGIEFLGTTLWTDMNNGDPITVWDSTRTMVDFRKIKMCDSYQRFTPALWMYENRKAVDFLEANIDADKRQVVVTHHAPTLATQPDKGYGGSHTDYYWYNTGLEDLIVRAGLWIYGHTHDHFDDILGCTRVVTNPRGYDTAGGIYLEEDFDEEMLIDLNQSFV